MQPNTDLSASASRRSIWFGSTRRRRSIACAWIGVLELCTSSAHAQPATDVLAISELPPAKSDAIGENRPSSTGNWQFGGYGELILQTSFYHPNPGVDDPSYRDTHLDLTRFALFVGTDISKRISFSSEIEFEHGGTGVAREIEWDEFGEYETELEKGGEIVLEQAYLEGRLSDHFTLRAGHLLVPVGMTTLYHTPNLFSSTRRPESESQLLPSIWHESGVELAFKYSTVAARFQLITGLDSTGFSSERWIAGGHQRHFERPLINDPAAVLAVDFTGIPGTLIGTGFYTSGTTRNRPKRDLYDTPGRVALADIHLRLQQGPLKLRSLFLVGGLSNAATITEANATLSNALGAPRTPVGRAAYAAYAEVAYDVISLLVGESSQRLDLFGRIDAYDSMWRAPTEFDNPSLERRALTCGFNYFPHPRVVTKAEFVSRWLNENRRWERRQSEVNAALGFVL